jgi:hypothetical protein
VFDVEVYRPAYLEQEGFHATMLVGSLLLRAAGCCSSGLCRLASLGRASGFVSLPRRKRMVSPLVKRWVCFCLVGVPWWLMQCCCRSLALSLQTTMRCRSETTLSMSMALKWSTLPTMTLSHCFRFGLQSLTLP